MQRITDCDHENRPRMAVAFVLMLLLPWLLLVSRVGVELATAGIGLLFLWRSAALRDWRWLHTPTMKLALLAWVWLMLGVSPWAPKPMDSFLFALPWMRYMLLFAAMRYWLLTSRSAQRTMAAMLAALVAFCTIDTLWQYATGVALTGQPIWDSGRLTGPLATPKIGIFIAKFLLSVLVILSACTTGVTRRWAVALGVGTLVVIAAILLTGERTAFAMTVAALLLATLLVTRHEKQLLPYAAAMFGMLCLCVVVLFLTQDWVHHTLDRTVATLQNFSQSPYGKVFTAALTTGYDHWLTGVGIRGFRDAYESLMIAQGPAATGEHFMHAHNPYLEWFAEAGLVGLLLMVAIVLSLLREVGQMLRGVRGAALIPPALLMGVLLLHFFPFMSTQSYFTNWTAIMGWYALGAAFSVKPWAARAAGSSQ
jgi:O-antigen ligase